MLLHLAQHRFNFGTPFQWSHRDYGFDAWVAFSFAFDKLDFINILAAAVPEIGIAFKKHHSFNVERTAITLVILDVVRVIEKWVGGKGRIPQLVLIPDVQMGINDWKIWHQFHRDMQRLALIWIPKHLRGSCSPSSMEAPNIGCILPVFMRITRSLKPAGLFSRRFAQNNECT